MLPSDHTAWWAVFYFVRMVVFMGVALLIVKYIPLEVIAVLGIYYALEFSLGHLLTKHERISFGRN